MKNKNDEKALSLIKEINKRKDEIAKIEKPQWKTNCTFSYVEEFKGSYNLQVVTDVKLLVLMAAEIKMYEETYLKTASLLGVEAPPFTWNGFSADDWMSDIKSRINKIQISTKKKQLEMLEAKANQIISAELRAELELQAISKELGL